MNNKINIRSISFTQANFIFISQFYSHYIFKAKKIVTDNKRLFQNIFITNNFYINLIRLYKKAIIRKSLANKINYR